MIHHKKTSPEVARRVVDALGGQTILAKKMQISNSAVCHWCRKGMPLYRLMLLQALFPNVPEVKETIKQGG
jgi:hypothetical protein